MPIRCIAQAPRSLILCARLCSTITTAMGDGTAASSGDGGDARLARTNNPYQMLAMPDGGFMVMESTCIRRVWGGTGNVTSVAGLCGTAGSAGDLQQVSTQTTRFTLAYGIGLDGYGGYVLSDGTLHVIRR